MALLKRKRAGLNDAMSVVTRFVNACNRHDADGVAACLHPDFDSIQPMYPVRNFRGADQVRRNWQAIFDAEPGFRLTVLRSAATDDTVWLELHGAGREAEVAGVFVMGVHGDRIRWARIYSALVEPVPASMEGAPSVQEHGNGEVVEDSLIAPVLDMKRSGRRRRRSSVDAAVDAVTADIISTPVPEPEAASGPESEAAPAPEPDIEAEPVPEPIEPIEAVDSGGTVEAPEPIEAVDADGTDGTVDVVEMVELEPEVVVVVEEKVDVVLAVEAVVADTDAAPAGDVTDAVSDNPVSADDGPPTEAVEMAGLTETEPDPEPETPVTGDTAPPEPPRRRFGKRPRP